MLLAPACEMSACGDSSGAGRRPSATSTPTPAASVLVSRPTAKRKLSAEVGPFERAIAKQDCKTFFPYVLSFARSTRPGAAATSTECRRANSEMALLRGLRLDTSVQFDTGGLMEGPTGTNARRYLIWAVDSDGRFRYSRLSGTGQAEVGTPFRFFTESARVANRFVRAVREKDCGTMAPLFSQVASRLVTSAGSRMGACRAVLRGKFLAPALAETADPRIEVLGGTRDIAFVGVATKRAYFTMALGDFEQQGLLVFDIVPSTPVKLPAG
jgi:hypothetical protein